LRENKPRETSWDASLRLKPFRPSPCLHFLGETAGCDAVAPDHPPVRISVLVSGCYYRCPSASSPGYSAVRARGSVTLAAAVGVVGSAAAAGEEDRAAMAGWPALWAACHRCAGSCRLYLQGPPW